MHDSQVHAAHVDVGRLSSFILEQLQAGTDRETIRIRVMASGVPEAAATQLVDRVCRQSPGLLEAEQQSSGGYLLPAVIGGCVGAVVGGFIWGMIAMVTGYEIGWVAWGVGVLAGWGVLIGGQGGTGAPYQLVAVAAAFLGIVIGKYFTFYDALKVYVGEEFGPEAVAEMSALSAGAIQAFTENIGSMMSGFDALWIILAVGTAWGIPREGAGEE